MREIKFRAWDCNTEAMCNVARIDWSIGFDGHPAIYFVDRGWVTHSSDYILEQFTGLRDKNGREIYEGDIVQRFSGDRGSDIVWCDDSACFDFSESTSFLLSLSSMYEVIGNIHENPELLS